MYSYTPLFEIPTRNLKRDAISQSMIQEMTVNLYKKRSIRATPIPPAIMSSSTAGGRDPGCNKELWLSWLRTRCWGEVSSVLRSSSVQFLDHNWPQLQLVETKASFLDNWTKLYRTSSHQSSCSISTGFNWSSSRPVETSSYWS